jgi:hypothetical protein
MKKILLSPVTHFNLLIVGTLILIGVMHNRAHHKMEVDVDGYARQLNGSGC